jgi:peptidoglycan hydrolase CwlO-like protein
LDIRRVESETNENKNSISDFKNDINGINNDLRGLKAVSDTNKEDIAELQKDYNYKKKDIVEAKLNINNYSLI